MIAAVEAYLALRRAAGYSMRDADRILRSFGRFAHARRDRFVKVSTIHAWARRARSPERREALVRKAALLARHLHAEDPRHEVPSYRVFAADPFQRPEPFIFLPAQIVALMDTARRCPSHGDAYATLIGLLAATGMRISEALSLRVDDLTRDGLIIRETKCHKSRLVPLHPTAERELVAFLKRRGRPRCDRVFVGVNGGPLSYDRFKVWYRRFLADIGLDYKQTEHELALSTYLGHATVASTYWYLEATPPLLTSIAERCARFARTSR
jgi:integrase/recombinase XerD